MESLGIIIPFNIFENRQMQFIKGMVCPAVGFFLFQILKEAFVNGIVKVISFFRKGLYQIQESKG